MFPKALRRDIIVLICIKAAALTFIYFACVAPATGPEPDSGAVAGHILHGSGD
jgi:hypothetical protein